MNKDSIIALKTTSILSFLILGFSLIGSGCGTSSAVQDEKSAVDSLLVEKWVSHLASDEMKGRRNGSEEMKAAAEWIAGKFREFGLNPPPGHKMYMQEYLP